MQAQPLFLNRATKSACHTEAAKANGIPVLDKTMLHKHKISESIQNDLNNISLFSNHLGPKIITSSCGRPNCIKLIPNHLAQVLSVF